jgi:hypothetical protein
MAVDDQRQEAMAQVRAVYEDGEAEINGRKYKLHKMQHVERRKVFAFYTSVQHQMQAQNFIYLDSPAFSAVEAVMWGAITFEGELISKRRDHWEEYPEDYLQLVSVAMGVMSYPFIRASGIASASKGAQPQKTTSAKPM